MRMSRVSRALLLWAAMTCCPAFGLELGSAAGPINVTNLSGGPTIIENYRERPATAILLLSARCPQTERVIADINQLYRKHRLRNLLFVGVCANEMETADELRDFAQRRGVIFPIYRDPTGDAVKKLTPRFTPELFLLDREGALVFHGGLQSDEARRAVDNAIANVLAKKPVEVRQFAVEGTPLGKPGASRAVSDPYGAIGFASELVFEKIPFAAAHHCSTICEAANGDLLCLWYGGSYESADDQVLFLARRAPKDKSWSEPRVLMQNAAQPPGNGVIFRGDGDKLWIVWCRMEGTRPMRRGSGWDRCRLMQRTSTDHGATWSDDKPLFEETLWCVPRNPPIRLSTGSLLLPVEGLLNDTDGSHFLTLAPNSTSWHRAGFTDGGSQPAVIQRNDGSLLALLRHSQFIRQIESRDDGQTWTTAEPTGLKNPNAGISMTRLANGHLVLVFNDSQTSRTPLSMARSLDEGKTWEKPLQLESNPGEYSYPCVIQSADGRIHISYTYRRYAIKHVALNEDWLIHLDRPN
jgi:predicted neuraminidase